MRKTKKVLAGIMSFCMAFSMLPGVTANAASDCANTIEQWISNSETRCLSPSFMNQNLVWDDVKEIARSHAEHENDRADIIDYGTSYDLHIECRSGEGIFNSTDYVMSAETHQSTVRNDGRCGWCRDFHPGEGDVCEPEKIDEWIELCEAGCIVASPEIQNNGMTWADVKEIAKSHANHKNDVVDLLDFGYSFELTIRCKAGEEDFRGNNYVSVRNDHYDIAGSDNRCSICRSFNPVENSCDPAVIEDWITAMEKKCLSAYGMGYIQDMDWAAVKELARSHGEHKNDYVEFINNGQICELQIYCSANQPGFRSSNYVDGRDSHMGTVGKDNRCEFCRDFNPGGDTCEPEKIEEWISLCDKKCLDSAGEAKINNMDWTDVKELAMSHAEHKNDFVELIQNGSACDLHIICKAGERNFNSLDYVNSFDSHMGTVGKDNRCEFCRDFNPGKVEVEVKQLDTPKLSALAIKNGSIEVSWDAVEGASLYRVFKKNADGKWTKLKDVTTTTFVDNAVNSGNTYTYTVRCVSADGKTYESDYNKTGIKTLYCSAPVLDSVAIEKNTVKVTWKAVKGAPNYRVYRKTVGGKWSALADTTSTTYTDKTAKSGVKYIYTVKCINETATKTLSAYDTAGKSITFYSMPVLKSVTATSKGVKVAWGAVAGAKNYGVYRKTGTGSWKKIAMTSSTSYVDKTAEKGKKYTYTVRCLDESGSKKISDYNKIGLSIKY